LILSRERRSNCRRRVQTMAIPSNNRRDNNRWSGRFPGLKMGEEK
jgi:hypothetical protein